MALKQDEFRKSGKPVEKESTPQSNNWSLRIFFGFFVLIMLRAAIYAFATEAFMFGIMYSILAIILTIVEAIMENSNGK